MLEAEFRHKIDKNIQLQGLKDLNIWVITLDLT